jgi:3D (Asp-Asp-Asp) domain-containing protein
MRNPAPTLFIVALATGCLEGRSLVPSGAPTVQTIREADGEVWNAEPFELTYYWVATESKNEIKDTTLFTPACQPIATVSRGFAARAALEGTGRMEDGRVINTRGACDCPSSPCFFVTRDHEPWGVGVRQNPLKPFRSVAVDPSLVDIGTPLYVPEFEGLTMPGDAPWGGFVHDGCVIAADQGGGVRGRQIDFFTGQRHHSVRLRTMLSTAEVTVLPGYHRCGS